MVERKQTLIKEYQLKSWFEAVFSLSQEDGTLHETTRDYLLTLILTGMRRTECAKLTWDNIDFKEKTLKIIDPKNTNTKSKTHTLPLSDYLYDLLKNRFSRIKGHFVFPNKETATGYIGELRRYLALVQARSDVTFSAHDIRRTFITTAESQDISVYALKSAS